MFMLKTRPLFCSCLHRQCCSWYERCRYKHYRDISLDKLLTNWAAGVVDGENSMVTHLCMCVRVPAGYLGPIRAVSHGHRSVSRGQPPRHATGRSNSQSASGSVTQRSCTPVELSNLQLLSQHHHTQQLPGGAGVFFFFFFLSVYQLISLHLFHLLLLLLVCLPPLSSSSCSSILYLNV